MSQIYRKSVKVFIVAVLVINFSGLVLHDVQAAAVTVSVSSPANASFAALTATDVTFGYTTSSTEFENGDSITVSIQPDLAGALADCTSATTDADGDATPDGAFNSGSFSSSTAVYEFTAPTTTASTTGIDLCIRFPAATTTGNYSIAITDDNDNDLGAALVYVGDDNDVTVTAQVTPTLAFNIRDAVDSTDTNECELGVLSIASVSTCSYRLKVTTNSQNGYTVNVDTDGDLRVSGSGDVADGLDIDPVVENNTVVSGTEAYGVEFNGGAATVGAITESGDFNDDDTPLPINSATAIYSSSGSNNPAASSDTTNTALVTHRATVDGDTLSGAYSHIVTYTVTASF
ncbi:MAG: hypothetical protein ACOCXP_01085 [Candidatus Dojkabacteria bacterium]